MKKRIIFSAFVGVLLGLFLAHPASAISEEQKGAIVQNCASIKQSLRTLQRTDARSRSYLGSAYETILSKFIAPLNLRLINTNQPNANLTTIHSSIIDTRKNFITEYTTYSQALEDLVASDCYNHPEEFYDKLLDTKKKRANVSTTTTNLRNLLSEYLTGVRKLKSTMEAKDGGE
ncbi:hypothetical protein IJI69_04540 [Candidatus Saccharibacteria bacterium]|nr:hypothetical protein [Candidatus Saccharibacteria bacterium]